MEKEKKTSGNLEKSTKKVIFTPRNERHLSCGSPPALCSELLFSLFGEVLKRFPNKINSVEAVSAIETCGDSPVNKWVRIIRVRIFHKIAS